MSIVTLEEKFLAACATPSPEANRLAQLLKVYKATTTSFSNLRFCEAKPLLLSELYVGTEIAEQRPIDLDIVYNILKNLMFTTCVRFWYTKKIINYLYGTGNIQLLFFLFLLNIFLKKI